ncbi:MAG: hypothetical protein ACRDRO_09360, partial [Pseudonocardiaceae bacterium]
MIDAQWIAVVLSYGLLRVRVCASATVSGVCGSDPLPQKPSATLAAGACAEDKSDGRAVYPSRAAYGGRPAAGDPRARRAGPREHGRQAA